jgi:ribosomal protein L12E/L44/L45/RPP1/RPP2
MAKITMNMVLMTMVAEVTEVSQEIAVADLEAVEVAEVMKNLGMKYLTTTNWNA